MTIYCPGKSGKIILSNLFELHGLASSSLESDKKKF